MGLIIEASPSNKASFQELLQFAKQVLSACDDQNITPIVYGSLAYFAHTKDQTLPVRDLDLLVPESSFPKLQESLSKMEGLTFEQKPYHSIEAFKGGLEIDLDSIEHFLDPRSRETVEITVEGLTFHVLNRDSLISIYQEALDNMPKISDLDEKRSKYGLKLSRLKEVQSINF